LLAIDGAIEQQRRIESALAWGLSDLQQLSGVHPDQPTREAGVDHDVAWSVIWMDLHRPTAAAARQVSVVCLRVDRPGSAAILTVGGTLGTDSRSKDEIVEEQTATAWARLNLMIIQQRLVQSPRTDRTFVLCLVLQVNHALDQPAFGRRHRGCVAELAGVTTVTEFLGKRRPTVAAVGHD
jgi:hypothetical protein